jgi:hypothetical protein
LFSTWLLMMLSVAPPAEDSFTHSTPPAAVLLDTVVPLSVTVPLYRL